MYEFKLPDLGEGIHEGEILKWHVQPGNEIKEDSPLVDIETDKAAATIPSPKGGRIASVNAKIGDIVSVGKIIAIIDDGTGKPLEAKTEKPPKEIKATETKAEFAPVVSSIEHIPAAPATRRLARELGIDLNLVKATGPGGRITPEDIKRYVDELKSPPKKTKPAPPVEPDEKLATAEFAAHAASAIPFLDIEPLPDFSQWGPIEKEQLRSIRRKIAHKMVTSKILIPHVAHMDEADVTLLEEFRIREKEKRAGKDGQHLTLLPFVIKAVVAGLKATPSFNASLDPFSEEIIYKKYYNIGIATDTPKGLMVPVIKHANEKSIIELSNEIHKLVTSARDGTIDVQDLKGGTFSITNVGPLGGTALIAAINYPEVAILGMGKVQEKPVVRDGQIVIRKILPLSLSFDHRVTDGADAARFVTEMIRELSDPNLLLLET